MWEFLLAYGPYSLHYCNTSYLVVIHPMPQSDERFLAFRIYRFRDDKAFSVLYLRYNQSIRRFLASKLPRREDADELASEVFLHAWEYMTANNIEYPLALYFKIAKNLIANFYRARQAKPATVEFTPEMEMSVPRPGSLAREVEIQEETAELMTSMQEIKEEYREVLTMRYLAELDVEEIARALEKTPNNVRVLLFRAKQALRKKYPNQ